MPRTFLLQMRSHLYTYIHVYTRTYMYTHMCAYIHTGVHTCIHIHMYILHTCIMDEILTDSLSGVWSVWLWQDSYTEGVHCSNVTAPAVGQNVNMHTLQQCS